MKYVKLFEWFREEDKKTCIYYDIKNYTINPDGSIDVNNSVKLKYFNLKELPIRFGRVERDFICSNNRLETLEGAPNYVGGNFECDSNKLTTLEGSPNYIDGDFYCDNNYILTFEGVPDYINGYFFCNHTPIYYIWKLFRNYSKIELLNDYDALRIEDGKGICILSRLNGFLEDIGKPKVKEWQIKIIKDHYEIR